MGRTPSYNNGKDHWSIGSILFRGLGIKGNRVIGTMDEKQVAEPLEPKSLAIHKDAGIRVRPEHIHKSLRHYAGISDHPFTLKFPVGVKDEEQSEGFWG